MANIFHGTFRQQSLNKSRSGDLISWSISATSYSGSSTELRVNSMRITNKNDTLFEPLVSTVCEMDIVDYTEATLAMFLNAEDDKWLLQVDNTTAGFPIYKGFLVPDLVEYGFYELTTLSFTDNINTLKYKFPFTNYVDGVHTSKFPSEKVWNCKDVIKACLDDTGIVLPIYFNVPLKPVRYPDAEDSDLNDDDYSFKRGYVTQQSLIQDIKDPYTAEDVLSGLLLAFNVRVTQLKGKWVITDNTQQVQGLTTFKDMNGQSQIEQIYYNVGSYKFGGDFFFKDRSQGFTLSRGYKEYEMTLNRDESNLGGFMDVAPVYHTGKPIPPKIANTNNFFRFESLFTGTGALIDFKYYNSYSDSYNLYTYSSDNEGGFARFDNANAPKSADGFGSNTLISTSYVYLDSDQEFSVTGKIAMNLKNTFIDYNKPLGVKYRVYIYLRDEQNNRNYVIANSSNNTTYMAEIIGAAGGDVTQLADLSPYTVDYNREDFIKANKVDVNADTRYGDYNISVDMEKVVLKPWQYNPNIELGKYYKILVVVTAPLEAVQDSQYVVNDINTVDYQSIEVIAAPDPDVKNTYIGTLNKTFRENAPDEEFEFILSYDYNNNRVVKYSLVANPKIYDLTPRSKSKRLDNTYRTWQEIIQLTRFEQYQNSRKSYNMNVRSRTSIPMITCSHNLLYGSDFLKPTRVQYDVVENQYTLELEQILKGNITINGN